MNKIVLNAGAGYSALMDFAYAVDEFEGWDEIRLDINPDTNAHIIGDIRQMKNIASNLFDAVFSCHTLEHIYTTNVPYALREFRRVLKPGGFVALYLPDFRKIAPIILGNRGEEILYEIHGNKIRAVDMIFGLEGAIINAPMMMHKTLFTKESITKKLTSARFKNIKISEDEYDLWVKAYK